VVCRNFLQTVKRSTGIQVWFFVSGKKFQCKITHDLQEPPCLHSQILLHSNNPLIHLSVWSFGTVVADAILKRNAGASESKKITGWRSEQPEHIEKLRAKESEVWTIIEKLNLRLMP
jgi:hypothetical protein